MKAQQSFTRVELFLLEHWAGKAVLLEAPLVTLMVVSNDLLIARNVQFMDCKNSQFIDCKNFLIYGQHENFIL